MRHPSTVASTLSLALVLSPAAADLPAGDGASWLTPTSASWRLFDTPLTRPPGVRVDEVGARLLDTERLDIGLVSRHRSGLYDPPPQRWTQTDVGLFTVGRLGGARLGTRWSTLLDPRGEGGFQGLRGDLSAGYVARFGERFDLSFGLGATWTDADYRNGSLEPLGRPLQPARDDGFRDASLQIGACYRFAEDWSLGARLGYRRYLDPAFTAAAGAPDEGGDFVTGIQLNYRLGSTGASSPGLFSNPCLGP